jgi:hypothetical protein
LLEKRVMRGRIAVTASLLTIGLAPLARGSDDAAAHRDFVIKAGVMEPADAHGDRLRETQTISADPRRRPGWCFIVDPPSDAPYEIYSVHHLPSPPDKLTGDFSGAKPDSGASGLKTAVKRTDGIRPFCFDFNDGDPLGEYKVEIFIDGSLKTTLRLQVVAPSASPAPSAEPAGGGEA